MVAYTFSQLIDFTRVSTGANLSPGTFVGSNGLIQLSTASTNLLLWTQEFDNAAWVKTSVNPTANSVAAPDGTMTADTLTASGANGTTLQTYTAAAVPYVFSVWLRRLTGTGNIQLTVDGSTYSTVAVTTTWTRFSTTLTPAAGSRTAGTRIVTSGDAVYVWGAQLEQASTATAYTRNVGGVFPPRFDFNPITLAPLGILIEETRANRTLQSEDFTAAPWAATVSGTSTRVNSNTALGFMRGLVTATSASGGIRQSYTGLTSSQVYALSFYIQSTTTAVFVIMENGTATFGSPHSVTINPSNGTAGVLTGFTSISVQPFGPGYVYTLVTAPAGGTLAANFEWRILNNGDSILYGRPQFEAGAFATSYIPTAAAILTRNADRAAIVAPMFTPWFSASAGTFVAKFDLIGSATSTLRRHVWNGTDAGNQRLSLRGIEPATGFPLAAIGTGTSVVSFNGTALTVNTPVNIAVAYGTNMAYSQNGAAAITDPSTASVSISSLDIGSNLAGTLFLNGHLRSIDYYPTRLSNAQLQALTV
jgi:hypothetical protein